jgi:hypothetical protein
MIPRLETSAQIIRFVEHLSHFIDEVKITEVYSGGFSFKVKVPMWIRPIYGWRLRQIIQREMDKHMLLGVDFKFKLYSETIF